MKKKDSYSAFFDLNPNEYKYIFENFIVGPTYLYVFYNSLVWNKCPAIWKGDNLLVFGSFRRCNYIYFMNQENNLLYRINTIQNVLEQITYSDN